VVIGSDDGTPGEDDEEADMQNMQKGNSKTAPLGELSLSLALHTPNRILVTDALCPGKILLHLEIRNRSIEAWEGETPNGPMLEIALIDELGVERARQTRLCPMLAFPTRLEPGRGFNLPLSLLMPAFDPAGETFQLDVHFVPGHERASGKLRVEVRA
jgi:hypothetical protein